MGVIASGSKQTLTSGYGTGLTTKQKRAVNIIQTPFQGIDSTWAAGAAGTGPGNAAYRRTDPTTGLIETQVHIDLTGLGNIGVDEDVIGLAAGGVAYIYRNVVADNGVIFKYTVACIEAPSQTTATITQNIDFTWNASATLEYNGAAGTPEVNTATLVAGEVWTSPAVTGLTANDYLYITEGDGTGTTGVYAGGQFVITFYGYTVR